VHSWVVEFARQTCRLQKDKELHKRISEQTAKFVPTWDMIGRSWNEFIQTLLK
jgi:hypothetical protein